MAKINLSHLIGNYDAEFLGNGKGFVLIRKGFFEKIYSGGLYLLKRYTQNERVKNPKRLRYPIITEEGMGDSLDADLQEKQINLDMLNDHPGDHTHLQHISDEIKRSLRGA